VQFLILMATICEMRLPNDACFLSRTANGTACDPTLLVCVRQQVLGPGACHRLFVFLGIRKSFTLIQERKRARRLRWVGPSNRGGLRMWPLAQRYRMTLLFGAAPYCCLLMTLPIHKKTRFPEA